MLSVVSIIIAMVLMVTAKQSLQQLVDVVALSTGTSIKHLDMSEYDGERLLWHLMADTAVEEDKQVTLSAPVLDLYTNQGELMQVRSLQGLYDQDKQVMHFIGEVSLQYQGWTLHGAILDFDEQLDEVWVPKHFVLSSDDMRISGINLQVSRQTGLINILGGVHVEMEGLE